MDLRNIKGKVLAKANFLSASILLQLKQEVIEEGFLPPAKAGGKSE